MSKWDSLREFFKGKKEVVNKFNESFLWGTNGYTSNDDRDLKKYIDLAYNINPDVYSVVSQISNKLISVPYSVKSVKDMKSFNKANRLLKNNNYNLDYSQKHKSLTLELKAGIEDIMEMPLERPNSSQTWDQFFKLSEVFLNTTGNIYWYLMSTEHGMNKGEPLKLYVLPSHLIEIVLKKNSKVTNSSSDPIDYYILTESNSYTKFECENIVHISINNPNFGFNGEHLYGQSPLRAAWKNIEASNKGLDLNVSTLLNGGVFGFVHGKGAALGHEQAEAFRSRLKEMNADKSELGRIAGLSTEIGFTRLSLSTDELKPFEYLKYNQKQICNVLGWSDSLLNNDDGGKHDKQKEERKRVVTDTVIPHIKLIESAFNSEVMPRFKNQRGNVFSFDVKEIPELQADFGELSKWVGEQVDRGLFSRNTALLLLGMPVSEDPNMDIITVKDDIMSLEDALLPSDDINNLN